jgi:DNA transformation protein
MSRASPVPDDSIPVGEMLNLGPTSAAWLREVGVRTAGDLKRLGATAAYLMVKARHAGASLNLLDADTL